MDNKIERQINLFLEGLGGVKRKGFFHGTLYMVLHNDRECDFYHKELRKFYREFKKFSFHSNLLKNPVEVGIGYKFVEE